MEYVCVVNDKQKISGGCTAYFVVIESIRPIFCCQAMGYLSLFTQPCLASSK